MYKQDIDAQTEIIVIDNKSPGFDIEDWRKNHPKVVWLTNDLKKNPYTSRNIGAEEAIGKYLAFIDTKCEPQAEWLRQMSAACDTKHPIVAGHYNLHYEGDAIRDKVYGMLYLNTEKNVRKDYGVTAGNLLFCRETYNAIGAFGDSSNSGNDIEWSRRALLMGHKIAYASNAIVDYPAQSWVELNESVKKYARGVAAIDGKQSWSISHFLPLRYATFMDHLRHRKLQNLGIWDRLGLWLLTWQMKIKYGVALFKSRNRVKAPNLNNSK